MSVYDLDLRRKVIAVLEQGESVSDVARRFDLDPKTVRSYRRRAASGRLEADKTGPQKPTKLTESDLQLMRQQVAANPGITLLELRDMLSVRVAESTVHRALKKMNISFKKSR